jgi:hypothetical protein
MLLVLFEQNPGNQTKYPENPQKNTKFQIKISIIFFVWILGLFFDFPGFFWISVIFLFGFPKFSKKKTKKL